MILCARNFLSHTHNAIVNKHRQNALLTFKSLAGAAGNNSNQDIILTQAAACIFSPQDTGYTKHTSETSSGAANAVMQNLPRVVGRWGGCRPPQTASKCAKIVVQKPRKGEDGKMKDTMIGVDLAKNVFQFHGASMRGEVKFRKKLTRPQFRRFMADRALAVVVMEAFYQHLHAQCVA